MMYINKNSEYLSINPNWHAEDSPWKANQILKILNCNNLPKFNSVVEIGCGVGEILNQLQKKLSSGIEFSGFDISFDAINVAKSKENSNLKFFHKNIFETNQKFDLMLMMDVFEHVDDYLGFLKQSKSYADYTIFHVPMDISFNFILRNKMVYYRRRLGHLHYFTSETALATIQDCGFDIIDYFITAGPLERPAVTFKSKVAYLPRKLLFMMNKNLASKIFGGFSILILAKNKIL